MTTPSESLLTPTAKALQSWNEFLPKLQDYQTRYQFTDFATLGFPGLTPDGITTQLTELEAGLEEWSPVLDLDPWLGSTVQEINSDDKFGQFIAALALDETNTYGAFKAAIPRLRDIRSILVRNGYAWALSPKLKDHADGERAIQRALSTVKKQGKEVSEIASRTRLLSQETEAAFSTINGQVDGIRSAFETLTNQQQQMQTSLAAVTQAGLEAGSKLQEVENKKNEVEKIAEEFRGSGPKALAELKDAQTEIQSITNTVKQHLASAESAASSAAKGASALEQAKDSALKASDAANSALAQATTATQDTLARTEATKKSAEDVERLVKTLGDQFKEIDTLRTKAQDVVKNAERAWHLANRHGLAKSFDDAAKGYRNTMFFWVSVFSLAVVAVCWIALEKIIPLATGGRVLDITSLVFTLLSGPILWGAWIASREISKNSQMRDEYRFKASVAMALEGYKREAGEVDPALVRKLLEQAVGQFAENPALRVHRANAPATPIHDALDRLRGKNEVNDNVVSMADTNMRRRSTDMAAPAATATPNAQRTGSSVPASAQK